MPQQSAKTLEQRKKGLRILFAEDERITSLQFEITLTLARHEVIGVARDARSTVRLASATKPDLALVDVHLADGTSGIDAAKEMHQLYGVRTLFLTADVESCRRAKGPFAIGCLVKPFTDEQLLAAIEIARARMFGGLAGKPAAERGERFTPANLELY